MNTFSLLPSQRGNVRRGIKTLCLLATVSGCAPQTMTTATAQTAPPSIRLEAENATLSGVAVATTRGGFSGTGYVTGFDADGDKLVWNIPFVAPGIYDVRVRYSAPNGEKGYDLVVNGTKTSGIFAPTGQEFATAKAGKVELQNGANTIAIEKGWGYYDVDALELVPASSVPAVKKLPATLVDAKASAEARALMNYLVGLYGQKTLSGQQAEKDIPYVVTVSGKTPAIFGGDLIAYSPTRVQFGSKPEGTTEKLIQKVREGHILTVAWHWNAPSGLINQEKHVNAKGKTINALWWRGFYTEATTFDLKKALADPKSADYKLLLRDMDVIAAELKKLQAARVPVLWRPLHEAEGGWFWWGAKGPEPFKQLWRLMFDRYTKHHQLHNLICVYTSGGKIDWYPGDAYVDIVGTDAYPKIGDPLSGIWEDLRGKFDGKKLLALSEIGAVPDVEKMLRYGVTWSYFMSWDGAEFGPTTAPKEMVANTYRSPFVLNRDQIPTGLFRPKS